MRDLRREVVALDAVRVVEEVERVVDRQPEPGAPRDEALVDLGRDAHLGDLVEHLGRDGQQPDQRRPGARPEHHLQAALEGEHLRVEARAGDDVGQQVLDVVEGAGLRDGVRQVEDLLLEQELLFVVEHRADGSRGACCRHDATPVRPAPAARPADLATEQVEQPGLVRSGRPATFADEEVEDLVGVEGPQDVDGTVEVHAVAERRQWATPEMPEVSTRAGPAASPIRHRCRHLRSPVGRRPPGRRCGPRTRSRTRRPRELGRRIAGQPVHAGRARRGPAAVRRAR